MWKLTTHPTQDSSGKMRVPGWDFVLKIPKKSGAGCDYLDVPDRKEDRIKGDRINGLFHLLLMGCFWGL